MAEGRIRKIIHVDIERTGARGRTVTVKVMWAYFQQSTRSRPAPVAITSRVAFHEATLALIRSVYPPPEGIRLVGVTLSNFTAQAQAAKGEPAELDIGVRAA